MFKLISFYTNKASKVLKKRNLIYQIFALCFMIFLGSCKKEILMDESTSSSLKYFQGGSSDKVNKIEKTADGGFIYCGFTGGDSSDADAFMMKVDANGKKQWYKTYGGVYYDEFQHAIQCSDGGYLAVGTTNSYGVGFTNKSLTLNDYIVKTNANGDEEWVKSYNYTLSQISHVMETKNHSFVMVGYHRETGNRSISLMQLLPNGDKEKMRNFRDWDSFPPNKNRKSWNEFSNYVSTADDGSILIAGSMDRSSRIVEVQQHITFMSKINPNDFDQVDFFYTYPDYVREPSYWLTMRPLRIPTTKIINTFDGYYIGTYLEMPGSTMAIQLIKTDLSGHVVWEKKYSGLGSALLYTLEKNSDGSLLLVGTSSKDAMNFAFAEAFGNMQTMLLKVDQNGNEIWTKYAGGSINANVAKCVQSQSDGGWLVAGFTSISNTGQDNMMMMKVSKEGEILNQWKP
jgi:hypothetical protein